MKVLELMRIHVDTLQADATIREAVDMMDLYRVILIPILDPDQHLLGVVTELDVASRLLTPDVDGISLEASGSSLSAWGEHPVTKIMTVPAVSIDENADVRDAIVLMVTHKVKRLPVTSQERVVGMISRIDVCQNLLETVS